MDDGAAQLAPGEVVAGRPFTSPANTGRDGAIMAAMLERLRAVARGWSVAPPVADGFLMREPDAEGLRTWIRVPDPRALLAAPELTAVGFFGRARAGVEHAPIHELEAAVVDTLELVPGILGYYDQELRSGYGNLILCDGPAAPVRWRAHELHRRAVELTPGHYHSVRLHEGVVRSPLLGDAPLELVRTRYFDYDSDPPWRSVRVL